MCVEWDISHKDSSRTEGGKSFFVRLFIIKMQEKVKRKSRMFVGGAVGIMTSLSKILKKT